jgi:hypothetical protein
MGTHMKTTIDIAGPLFERARKLAEREGTTLRALVEEGLRLVVERKPTARPFKLRDARYRGPGGGLAPEFASGGWERIREAVYAGRGG